MSDQYDIRGNPDTWADSGGQQARELALQEVRNCLGHARRALAQAKRLCPDEWGVTTQQALKAIVRATDEINELQDEWGKRYLRDRNERWGFGPTSTSSKCIVCGGAGRVQNGPSEQICPLCQGDGL